jgi:hypothetical protein
MNTQFGRVAYPYPFWIMAPSTRLAVVNQGVEGVFLPWASTVDTTGARPGTVTPLFVTSRGGGVEGFRVAINPMREWPSDSLRSRLLAVQVNGLAGDTTAGDPATRVRGRIIAVGSTDWATDNFLAPENVTFALNAIDWLAQDVDLITIRSKDRTPPKLVFESPTVQDGVKYANLVGIPVLLVLFAGVRLFRRRQQQTRPYQKSSEVKAA